MITYVEYHANSSVSGYIVVAVVIDTRAARYGKTNQIVIM